MNSKTKKLVNPAQIQHYSEQNNFFNLLNNVNMFLKIFFNLKSIELMNPCYIFWPLVDCTVAPAWPWASRSSGGAGRRSWAPGTRAWSCPGSAPAWTGTLRSLSRCLAHSENPNKNHYTVKKVLRFSRPQPGCHLPNSPWTHHKYTKFVSTVGVMWQQ